MKTILRSAFVLSALIFVLSTVEAEGCSCMARTTCEYASSADAVVVGKVLSSSEVVRNVKERVRPLGGDWEDRVSEQRVQVSRILVEETFLGSDAKEMLVETDIFSSCAFPLTSGITYIIYADRNNSTENLTTGMCSGTKPVSSASTELAMLRAERGKLSTVLGRVGFGSFRRLDPKQLRKFEVNTIKLVGSGKSYEESIGADGGFSFRGIPAGEYRLELPLPDTLMVDGEYNEEIAEELGIKDQRLFTVSGIGCVNKELPIRENGRISGRLIDDRDQPIPNVEVTAVAVGNDGRPLKTEESCYDTDLCVSSKKDGSYLLKGLKPGRYLIGVRLDDYICNDCADAKYKRTFYPGVPSPTLAKFVEVPFGKSVENIGLKLTDKYKEREIAGTVFFKNGRPAPNVSVRFVARTPDLKRNGITFIKTDKDGNFSLAGYELHSYMIGAFTDNRDGNETAEAKAVVLNIVPHKAVVPIRLVLDQLETDDEYHEFDVRKSRPKN